MLSSLFISLLRPCLVGMAALLATALFAGQASSATITYLINFGDSSYTTDGSNTWNAPAMVFFENVTTSGNEISLVDTSSVDHGLKWAVTARGATQGGWINYTLNDGQASWPSPSWFNSTVAQQRAFLNVWNGSDETWILSGFNLTDQVNVQWIAQHSQNNNTRTATYYVDGVTSNIVGGSAVTSLNYDTRRTFQDTTYLEWDVMPDGNGDLEFRIDPLNNSFFSSWGNAMRIQVTTEDAPAAAPEPSALALAATGLAAIGLLIWRRT